MDIVRRVPARATTFALPGLAAARCGAPAAPGTATFHAWGQGTLPASKPKWNGVREVAVVDTRRFAIGGLPSGCFGVAVDGIRLPE